MGLIWSQCTFPSTIVLNNRPYMCSGGSRPSDVGMWVGGGEGGGQSSRPWDKGGGAVTAYVLVVH